MTLSVQNATVPAALKRIDYAATLDDVVDTNLRIAASTKVFRRRRALYQWFTGTCFSAALIGTVMVGLASSRSTNVTTWIIVLGFGVAVGLIAASGSRRYFDWRIRRYYR